MSKLANVVRLNNSDENVYQTIHTFLTRKGQNSMNTKHMKDIFVIFLKQ